MAYRLENKKSQQRMSYLKTNNLVQKTYTVGLTSQANEVDGCLNMGCKRKGSWMRLRTFVMSGLVIGATFSAMGILKETPL